MEILDFRCPTPPRPVALGLGAGIGFLSGLTGTGGGIFLSPLLIFMRWARTKVAAAVSALFILVNSLSGLLGNLSATREFPAFSLPLAVAADDDVRLRMKLDRRRLQVAEVFRRDSAKDHASRIGITT